MSEPFLRTVGLTRHFGSFVAVDGVDLTITRGQVRGLIGPNGAGKTTLFELLSGTLLPTDGRIYLRNEDVTGEPAYRMARRGVGRALQIADAFPSLTVTENVLGAVNGTRGQWTPLARYADDEEALARVEAVLSRVDLADVADAPVGELSHADRKVLEVALALAGDPDVLLLDEPTAGLSAGETDSMSAVVRELRGEATILLVEHDMDVVMGLADRLTVLHQGAVLAEGTPADIREDDRVRDVYFGRDQ